MTTHSRSFLTALASLALATAALGPQQAPDDHAGRIDERLRQLLQAFEDVMVDTDRGHGWGTNSKSNKVTLFTLL